MGLKNLIPKRGVDKNGRQYTRLVRPDGADDNAARVAQLPTVSSIKGNYYDYLQTSESVLQEIPQAKRVNISPEQLDGVFEVMQSFGVNDADTVGFRRYISKREQSGWGHEWSERGSNSRYTQRVGNQGNIIEASLHSINGQFEDYPRYFAGQADIREALGLPRFNPAEVAYLAGRYWDSRILHTLGDIPAEGARGLRKRYIEDISLQPGLADDLVDGLKGNYHDTVGNVRTYVETLGNTEKEDYSEFIELAEQGKKVAAKNRLAKFTYLNAWQKDALTRKLNSPKK